MSVRLCHFLGYLWCVVIIISCSSLPDNEGEYTITYTNNDEISIKSVRTFNTGVVYTSHKSRVYKILPGSYVVAERSGYDVIEGGMLIFYNNAEQKILTTEVEDALYLDNRQGNAQFYRIKLPANLNYKTNVLITYTLGDDTKTLKPSLQFMFRNSRYKYYGFFIPLNMYWDIQSYTIDITIKSGGSLFARISKNVIVKSREWEKQVIYFNKKKSGELSNTDWTLFNQQKQVRKDIWATLTNKKFFRSGIASPIQTVDRVSSAYGLIREWRLRTGTLFSSSRHTGLDYPKARGTPVYAAADGIVRYVQNGQLIGNCIIIEHGFSLYTDYAHLNTMLVKEGTYVKQGQIIGTVGATGAATGPHLHWGARVNGYLVDPESLFGIEKAFIKD